MTQYNPLTAAPGALVQADDVVIRRENTIETRRGYASYNATLGAQTTQLLIYRSRVLSHNGTTLSYDNGSGTFANYSGSYTAPSGVKMRAAEAVSNLYVTTSQGVYAAMDQAGTALRPMGAPRALEPTVVANAAGSGFLPNNEQCAYRIVVERTDQNGNVLIGYPSARVVYSNASGSSKNLDLTVYLPSEITSSIATQFVVQVYRTAKVAYTGTDDNAGDEMYLAYQVTLSSADATAGNVAFTDSLIDELLIQNARLYTSPSQGGILQANDRPPFCKDIALYKSQFMIFANTRTKHRLTLTMLSSPSGLNTRTIIIAGTTYTFSTASENAATGQVLVSTTGTTAVDIDQTARSLVRVINRFATNTSVYAYYLSGSDQLPGQIMLEERSIGGSGFGIQAGDATVSGVFFPQPPTSAPAAGSASYSSNAQQKNAIFFSKGQEVEHVPALNYLLVGSANEEILRTVALRDSLIIIKEQGVWRLTGDDETSFTVAPLDLTVYCKAADSVATLANQVIMLSNQGVVAITDTGAQVISRDIEPSIIPLVSYSSIGSYTYGCAYESERSYMLSTMSSSSDTAPTQTWVFNLFTKTWVRWTFPMATAVVEPSADKIYFVKPSDTKVYRERKDFADTDYSDPDYAVTITAVSGTSVTLTSASAVPLSGWVLYKSSDEVPIASVVSNGANSYTLTLDYDAPASFTNGAATLYPKINSVVVYDAWTAGEAGIMKRLRQVDVLTDNISGNDTSTGIVATFKTDIDSVTDEVEIDSAGSAWGESPWGAFAWGGSSKTFAYPTFVPRNKVYARILTFGIQGKRARERVSISGWSIAFDMVSDRIGK